MRNYYQGLASPRDLTGTTHESVKSLVNDPRRHAISCKKLLDQKNDTLETIAEIDQLIHSGAYTEKQVVRMERKKEILFGKIALYENGLEA
jgi:hypothetical protein